MGQFSWKYTDMHNRSALKIFGKAYIPCPDGSTIYEGCYGGYGLFGGHDIYELVADWNKEYLSEGNIRKPDKMLLENMKEMPAHYQKIMQFYQFKCKRLKDFVEGKSEEQMNELYGTDWKRNIGIDIACENEANAALKFPIKICKEKPESYEQYKASRTDPFQGR